MTPSNTTPASPTRRIGPVEFALLGVDDAVAGVVAAVSRRQGGIFAFCNMHTFNIARRMPALATALGQGTVFNDGVAIDAASRIVHGVPFPDNLNGTDLTPAILSALDRPTKVFLLGSAPGVADRAGAILASRHPNVRIVGVRDGFFDAADSPRIVEEIRTVRTDLLLIGMGNPRQELWAADHGSRTGAVILCIGAFLDFTAGAVPRAPLLVRRLRAEWLYRLSLEPRRMFGRYIGGAPPFLAAILRERMARKR